MYLETCRVGVRPLRVMPHAHLHPQGTLTTGSNHKEANKRDALRLVATAIEVARRLRPVCADWPEEQFGALVYDAALVHLGGELATDGAERLRREFEAHRDMYLARLREPCD